MPRTFDADLSVVGKVSQTGTPTAAGDLVPKSFLDSKVTTFFLSPVGTADQTAINTAITTLSTAGGGIIVLRAGQWNLTASIRLKNNVTLQGEGDGTVLNVGALMDAPAVTNDDAGGLGNSNIGLKELQINGNGTAQTVTPNNTGTGVDGVYFIRVTNLEVSDCYIHTSNRHTLFVSDASGSVRVLSNRLANSLGLSNIAMFNCSDVSITGNVCSGANETGTKLDSCHTATISGNTYFNNTTIQVYLTGGSSIAVTGNSMRGGQSGVRIVSNDYITVTGNTLRSHSLSGIAIFQNVNYLSITGNVIRDIGTAAVNTHDGINIGDSGGACTDVTISGNVIIDSTTTTMRSGIRTLNLTDRVHVGINSIRGAVSGDVVLVGSNNTVAATLAGAETLTNKTLGTGTVLPVHIAIAISDETTALTTGTGKVTYHTPYAFSLSSVFAEVNTVSSSGVVTVDINEGAGAGTSVLSTKLSIDANEETSGTAATAAVISDSAIAQFARLTFDIDAAGTGAKGLKVHLLGTRTV